ncbi:hypothetical protein M9458_041328, partial [Cirrhinus mrigala]
ILFERPPLVFDYGCGLLVYLDLPLSYLPGNIVATFGLQVSTTALHLGLPSSYQ